MLRRPSVTATRTELPGSCAINPRCGGEIFGGVVADASASDTLDFTSTVLAMSEEVSDPRRRDAAGVAPVGDAMSVVTCPVTVSLSTESAKPQNATAAAVHVMMIAFESRLFTC